MLFCCLSEAFCQKKLTLSLLLASKGMTISTLSLGFLGIYGTVNSGEFVGRVGRFNKRKMCKELTLFPNPR